MRKLLIIFISFISFSSEWKDFSVLLQNYYLVKPGDIIVLYPEKGMTSQFGHIAYVNKEKKIVDFKMYGTGYSEGPIYTLATIDRQFKLLRYKEMTPQLLDEIEKEITNWYYKEYNVFVPLESVKEDTYCSHFIYQIFKEAGKKIDKNIQIATTNSEILLPNDFFNNQLYEVEI